MTLPSGLASISARLDDTPQVRGAVAFGRAAVTHRCLYPVDALADAWASIDGKLDEYRAGRNAPSIVDEPGGHFSGYQDEAAEMIRRLEARGYTIVKADPLGTAIDRHAALAVSAAYKGRDLR